MAIHTYLPRYNFSSSNKEPKMATNMSMIGLKLDTNNGPLIFIHHTVRHIASPEHPIPYTYHTIIEHVHELTIIENK